VIGASWARRRVMPQLAVAALPVFAAGLLVFYAWFGVGWYFTRYLAPVACVVALILAVGIARAWHARGSWRVPALVATALVLAIGVVAALRADSHQLTATRAPEVGFDSVTGYRDAARTVAEVPADGQKLGAWQSGAFGYYANDRFTVVNLDGVVNPDAADATAAHDLPGYIQEQHLDWLADFSLHIIGFAFSDSKRIHPSPSVETVKGLPQYPPFPEYGMARITWPKRNG